MHLGFVLFRSSVDREVSTKGPNFNPQGNPKSRHGLRKGFNINSGTKRSEGEFVKGKTAGAFQVEWRTGRDRRLLTIRRPAKNSHTVNSSPSFLNFGGQIIGRRTGFVIL